MAAAAWLVDIGYVVKASEGKFRLDYVETHHLLEERFGQTGVFLFNGFDPAYGIPQGLQKFYEAMKEYGMEIRLQPMQSGLAGTNRQRRVDVDISAHLVWQASQKDITTIVITTGDQDFVPAIEVARQHFFKRIVLFTYCQNVHRELVESADDWWLFESEMARLARL